MSEFISSLQNFIREDRDRSKREKGESWTGTMLEYLELGLTRPSVFDNAPQRLLRRVCINPPGLEEGVPPLTIISHETNSRRARALGLPKDGPLSKLVVPTVLARDFFDMEEVLNAFYIFLGDAAAGGITAKNIFFLRGGAGGGKSDLVEAIQQLLVGDMIFTINGDRADGGSCPVNHSPLWAIPLHLRKEISRLIGYPIHPTKDVCPVCSSKLDKDERWEHLSIVSKRISARRGQGLVKVPPFDPNTMGIEILIGSERIRLMHQYDSGDPKLMNFTGAFNRGTGGLIEMREIFKAPKEARDLLLIATEDDQYPSPGYATVMSSDSVIIAHSNLPEYDRQSRDPEQEAFFDRMVVEPVRYALSVSEDERIHQKVLSQRIVRAHLAPGTRDFLAMVGVFSRLELEETTKAGAKVMASASEVFKLMRLFDGEGGEGSEVWVAERRQKHPDEGFSGLTTRFLQRALSAAITRAEKSGILSVEEQQRACVTPDDLRASLRRSLTNRLTKLSEGKERAWLERMREAMDGMLAVEMGRRLKAALFKQLAESGVLTDIASEAKALSKARAGDTEFDAGDFEDISQLVSGKANGKVAKNRAQLQKLAELALWFLTSPEVPDSSREKLNLKERLPEYCPSCLEWNIRKACEPL